MKTFDRQQFGKKFLDSLPAEPGVYRFYNENGELIYVGRRRISGVVFPNIGTPNAGRPTRRCEESSPRRADSNTKSVRTSSKRFASRTERSRICGRNGTSRAPF